LNNLRLASAEAWTPVMLPAGALAAGAGPAPLLGGAMAAASTSPAAAESLPAPAPEPVQPQVSPEDEQVERIMIRLAEENPMTVAAVIQMWLGEDEKR
jgi:hypothetical protein